mmetsp:Transcript_11260/g.16445  ORF Transcript_11260/g.16445 Transcript_11260/m.16445 type:complete len:160 (-) Transcript_11260:146-625(-)
MVTSNWERICGKIVQRNLMDKKEAKLNSKHKKRKDKGVLPLEIQTKVSSTRRKGTQVAYPTIEMVLPGSALPTSPDTTLDVSTDESSTASSDEVDYDETDWDELPKDVKDAAKLLGYSERQWDYDIPIKLEALDWDQLNNKQQKAAMMIGYDQAKWDES